MVSTGNIRATITKWLSTHRRLQPLGVSCLSLYLCRPDGMLPRLQTSDRVPEGGHVLDEPGPLDKQLGPRARGWLVPAADAHLAGESDEHPEQRETHPVLDGRHGQGRELAHDRDGRDEPLSLVDRVEEVQQAGRLVVLEPSVGERERAGRAGADERVGQLAEELLSLVERHRLSEVRDGNLGSGRDRGDGEQV